MSVELDGELDFDTWKQLLRKDCMVVEKKLPEFEALGEYILKILYENGLDPTVEAIARDGLNGRNPAK